MQVAVPLEVQLALGMLQPQLPEDNSNPEASSSVPSATLQDEFLIALQLQIMHEVPCWDYVIFW